MVKALYSMPPESRSASYSAALPCVGAAWLRACVVMLGLMNGAQAATLSWFSSGSSGPAGGAGTWDTQTARWSANGSVWSAWNNAGSDTAAFGGAPAGTVTLATTIQANGVTFGTSGYTITSGTLTLVGPSPTISVNTTGTSATSSSGTIASVIAGTNGWTKSGSGTLVLTGSNAYSGGTVIANGTTVVGSPYALGGSLNSLAINRGTLNTGTFSLSVGPLSGSSGSLITTTTASGTRTFTTFVSAGTSTFAGAILDSQSGTGTGRMAFVKNGSGTLILTGTNKYSAGTTIADGVLQIGGGGSGSGGSSVTGTVGSGTIAIAGPGTLVWNRSDSYGGAYANRITGSGSLVLARGTLTLTATSPFSGTTSINAGKLVMNGSLASSTLLVNASGTLSGSGVVGATTVNGGGTILPGSTSRMLTTGNLTLQGGGNYNWQLLDATGTAGSQWGLVTSSGTLTVAATSDNPFAINLWTLSGTSVNGSASNFNKLADASWTIGRFAGGITGFSPNAFSVITSPTNGTTGFANSYAGTFSITTIGNDLDVVYVPSQAASFDYTGASGAFSDTANWSSGTVPSEASAITFSGPGGSVVNDLLSTVTSLSFTGSAAGSYTLSGSALTIRAGRVVNDSSSAQTLLTAVALGSMSGATANAGDLILSGPINNAGYSFVVDGSSSTTISSFSGFGDLQKTGPGTLTLTGSNSHAGGTTINDGMVVAGDPLALGGTGSALVMNGGTLSTGTRDVSVGALSGSAGSLIMPASFAGVRTLTVNQTSGTGEYAGVVRDNGDGRLAIVKSGSGTLVLTGSNAYSGGTVIANGTTVVGSPYALGGSLNSLAINRGTLNTGTFSLSVGPLSGSSGSLITTTTASGTRTFTTFVSAGTSTFAGAILDSQSGTGTGRMAFVKNGSGTLILTGTNKYSAGTTIADGVLQIGGGGSGSGGSSVTGTVGSGTIAIAGPGTLVWNRSDSYGGAYANRITGSGSLVLARGTLTLTATSPFSGTTSINAGKLVMNGSLASSTLLVNASGTLSGSGVVGATTVNGGGTILPGSTSRMLTTGNLTLQGGGNYNWQLLDATGTAGSQWGLVTSSGTLTVAATSDNPFAINLWTLSGTSVNGSASNFNKLADASWTIGRFAGGITGFSPNAFSVITSPTNGTGGFTNPFAGTFSVATVGNDLDIVYTAPVVATFDYVGGTGDFSEPTNWSTGVVPSNSCVITFTGSGGTTRNDLVSTVFGLTFGGAAGGSYTVTGSGMYLDTGTVANNSAFTQTIEASLTLASAAGVTANTADLMFTGPVNGAGYAFTVDGTANTTITSLSGTGALVKRGAGGLMLRGPNSYTGGTTIIDGTVTVDAALALGSTTSGLVIDGGTLNSGTYDITVGNFSGGSRGLVTTSADAGVRRLTVNRSSGTGTYAGGLQDNGVGMLSLVKAGTGTLVMTGSSSYGGGTTITSGTLIAGNDYALGGSSNALSLNRGTLNTGTQNLSIGALSGSAGCMITTSTVTGTRTLTTFVGGGTSTYAGMILDSLSGTGAGRLAVVKNGPGLLVLAGTQTIKGGFRVNEGCLRVTNSGSFGPIVTSSTFELTQQAANGTYASRISGTGEFVKRGTGTLLLSGTNVATGMTSVTEGILATGGAERLADVSAVSIADGATLRLGGDETIHSLVGSGTVNLQTFGLAVVGTGSSSFAGSIVGTGGLRKAGDGILRLSGSNAFLGATNLDAGTLILGSSSALSAFTTLTIAPSSALIMDNDVRVFAYTNLGGTLSGTGRLLTSATTTTGGVLAELADASGPGGYAVGLLKTSTDTLVVTGSTSFTGGIVLDQGTVVLDQSGAISAANVLDVRNGATLDLNGKSQTVAALVGGGSVALGGGSLTIDTAITADYAGTIGGGSVTKTGTGVVNLTGSSTTALTSVTAGLMEINGTLSGMVQVAPGGTLGGSGVIIGDVGVAGTHAPGNSPDISTITGSVTYGAGASVVWELASNSSSQGLVGSRVFDQIVVGGNLAFSGSTSLLLSFYDQDPNSSWSSSVNWSDSFWGDSHSWALWQVSGTTSGVANLRIVPQSWLDSNGLSLSSVHPNSDFTIQQIGNDVTLVYVVPEPMTVSLLGVAGIAWLLTGRACRSKKGVAAGRDCRPCQGINPFPSSETENIAGAVLDAH